MADLGLVSERLKAAAQVFESPAQRASDIIRFMLLGLCAATAFVSLAVPVESEVTFKGAGGFVLKGTFARPDSVKGKALAVLLLPGSGPTDRNGNQPPALNTDLLKQIAGRLAAAGWASLRFDKRAAHVYMAKFPKGIDSQNEFFKWENFVGDAKAALSFLAAQPGIDGKRLAVAGHSEGSMIAVAMGRDLAGRPGAPAGLILMGAPGRPLDSVIHDQVLASLRRSGLSEAAQKPYMDYTDKAIAQIKKDATVPPNPPQGLAALFPPNATKIMKSYFTNDPAKMVATYPGPVLVIQGEKDIQVQAKIDTPLLAKAIRARKKGASEIFIVPSASHNLKLVKDPDKEPGFAGPVVPAALDKIVTWLKANI